MKITAAGDTDAVLEASLDLAEDAVHTVLATGLVEDGSLDATLLRDSMAV